MDASGLRPAYAHRSGSTPAGLFVAERDGRIVGSPLDQGRRRHRRGLCRRHDPGRAQGGGLGTALTARGPERPVRAGDSQSSDLYVEGDNAPALKVYRNLGFVDWKKDVLYSPVAAS